MSDYRRIVSYLYQYEQGEKRENVGFVRIEIRGGQLKITIHITSGAGRDAVFPVYFYGRKSGQAQGIYVGEFVLKRGLGEFKTVTDAANIMGTGAAMEQTGGMILAYLPECFFATEWDDHPVTMRDFAAVTGESGNPEETYGEEEMPENAEDVPEVVDPQEKEKEPLQGEESGGLKEEKEWQERKRGELNEGPEFPENESAEWEKDKSSEDREKPDQLNRENHIQLWEQSTAGTVETTELPEKRAETRGSYSYGQYGEQALAISATENAFIASSTEKGLAASITEKTLAASATEQSGQTGVRAEHIFRQFPHMMPFCDNEITECVRIIPQDIGLLPMEAWHLGQNSFLQHGYHAHKHLIFARTRDKNEPRFLLGVPGYYDQRERSMARMFGFQNFKSVSMRPVQNGDFGYWYVPVLFERVWE